MVNLTIDGRKVQAEEGTSVLQAALDANIYIPNLCNNEAVKPAGICRLCVVEITDAAGGERTVASCMQPVAEGINVKTQSERLTRTRQSLIELLLARCPDSEVVQEVAARLGVKETRYPLQYDNKKCILCGLCDRVCREVVGVSAITMTGTAANRQLITPADENPGTCIGCGSCVYICPTYAITMKETRGKRLIMWPHTQMEHKMKKCKICGTYWATEREIKHMARVAGTSVKEFEVCPDCR